MSDRPALSSPTLSLCMIVKNESANLGRCLGSAKPHVDEIVVVDTGSEDDTVAIAQSFGATIGYFSWCNDFAAARNYALSLVTHEWVLVLDADEELIVEAGQDLRAVLPTDPNSLVAYLSLVEAGNLTMTALQAPRLFRNLSQLKYVGCHHEQLRYDDRYLSKDRIVSFSGASILHYGYGVEQVRRKNVERIPSLEQARQTQELSLMLLYTLAGMYGESGQLEKAEDCYAEAFERLLPHLLTGNPPLEFGMIPSLIFSLGAQSLQQRDYETALLLCRRGLEWCPQYPPLNYLAGMISRAIGFPLGAITYFEFCLQMGQAQSYYQGEPFELHFITLYPARELGCTYSQLEQWQDAQAAFELALSFDADCAVAKQNLHNIEDKMRTLK